MSKRFEVKFACDGVRSSDEGLSSLLFPFPRHGAQVNHLDEDAEKDLMKALHHLNRAVNTIRIGHPYAHELLGVIEKLEKSAYMQWLAKTRFKEQQR
jgi:hypothetical protein